MLRKRKINRLILLNFIVRMECGESVIIITRRLSISRFQAPLRGTSLVYQKIENQWRHGLSKDYRPVCQEATKTSQKNTPKQITIPVSTDGSIFHLCLCIRKAYCVRSHSCISWLLFARAIVSVHAFDMFACIEVHCHEPLEICVHMRGGCTCSCVSNARDRYVYLCASRNTLCTRIVHM